MNKLRVDVVDRAGRSCQLEARRGDLLMHVLRDKVDILIGTCGGAISCGTCLVLFEEDALCGLPPPNADEVEMLQALDAGPGARLACQIMLSEPLDGLKLVVAPES